MLIIVCGHEDARDVWGAMLPAVIFHPADLRWPSYSYESCFWLIYKGEVYVSECASPRALELADKIHTRG